MKTLLSVTFLVMSKVVKTVQPLVDKASSKRQISLRVWIDSSPLQLKGNPFNLNSVDP